MTQRKSILICGDGMWDEYWWGEAVKISPEAPVPVVRVVRQETRFGAAENVVANCVAMGETTDSAICKTSRKIRLVARNQQVARIDFDDPPSEKDVKWMESLFAERLPDCGPIVVFSDYAKGSLTNVQKLIAQAKAAGKTVLVDPKGHDYSRYEGADIVKPNLDEMRYLAGGWGSEEQLQLKVTALRHSAKISKILLTRGAEGMSLYEESGVLHFPSVAREIYDVTGAGDTAIAALAVCLNRGISLPEAVRYATKAAGIVVGKFGTAVATEKEVFSD